MSSGSRSARLYALLLWLYPPSFRSRFGQDMRELFADQLAGCAPTEAARLWARVLPSLLWTALVERWLAFVATVRGVVVPDPTPRKRQGDGMLSTLSQDIRFAARMLAKSPLFTVIAISVIALGSGAVTTIFSAANAIILRRLPGVVEPSRVYDIARSTKSGGGSLTPSYPYFEQLQRESRTMSGVAAWSMQQFTLSTGGEGISAMGSLVSANYFSLLGVRPALGRLFVPAEDSVAGAHPVVVLSHSFWTTHLAADRAAIGRTILLNGGQYTIVGVTPAEFRGLFPVVRHDVWVPLMMTKEVGRGTAALLTSSTAGWLNLFGRLAPNSTIEQSRAELRTITARAASTDKGFMRDFVDVKMSAVSGLPADSTGAVFGFVGLLFAVSAMVLIIASVNVAGMLLARANSRRREMAVRMALGAGRARLVRQLLTESVLLFLGGAAGGLLICLAGVRALEHIKLPQDVPVSVNFAPDARVVAFAFGSALVTGILFGLAPALQASRTDINAPLRSDTAGGGRHRSRLRNGLVIAQLSVSMVLLMAAGLFVRALDRGQRTAPGFETGNVATAGFDLTTSGYTNERAAQFYDALQQSLSAAPGVAAVSYTRILPLGMSSSGDDIRVDGYARNEGKYNLSLNNVAPQYFAALRMPLVHGREFLPTDNATAAKVAVVNERFVKEFWPDKDGIGQSFHMGEDVVTIVGVARDAKYRDLSEELRPFLYLPLAQSGRLRQLSLVVRTVDDPTAFTSIIRSAVRAIDPALPPANVITLKDATAVSLLPQRVAAGVTGVLGVVGLLLTAVGLYGVIAYSVSQRTREIGVRMALGATRSGVLGLVVREGMRLVLVGVAIGLVLSFAGGRAMTSFLFGLSPADPLTFVLVPTGLLLVTLVATYLPARRAAGADPMVALRYE